MSKKKTRVMRIYKRFFDMIKDGSKTIEIRVGYPSMRSITPGMIIRFNNDPDCERLVTRVAHYESFAEMMEAEDPVKINPNMSAEDQLKEIRKIFPPSKEKLGVIAYELAQVD